MNDLTERVTQELEHRLEEVVIPPVPVKTVRLAAARQRRLAMLGVATAAVMVVALGAVGAWVWSGQHRQAAVSGATAATIIDELPCAVHSTSDIQSGVAFADGRQNCLYHHHEIVLWDLEQGPNKIYPPDWARTIVTGTPGKWIAGCAKRADCETIQRRFGGDLSIGSSLGISIVVQ